MTSSSTDLAAAYEDLRAAALSADRAGCCFGLAVLRRQGLAAWLRDVASKSRPEPARSGWRSSSAGGPSPVADELTRLMATIVFSLATESAHA